MKGMVFAAGLGTRLRPLTDSVPKALVELDGVAMLERVLTRMKSYGIGEAVVNVHHFADKVRDFLREHDDFGMRLHISDESGMLLDTGGGVAAAADWLSAMSLCCYIMPTYIPMWILWKCRGCMRRRALMPRCLPAIGRHRAICCLTRTCVCMAGLISAVAECVRSDWIYPGWRRWRLEGFILYLPAWLRIYAVMAGPTGRKCFRLLTIISSRAAGCI